MDLSWMFQPCRKFLIVFLKLLTGPYSKRYWHRPRQHSVLFAACRIAKLSRSGMNSKENRHRGISLFCIPFKSLTTFTIILLYRTGQRISADVVIIYYLLSKSINFCIYLYTDLHWRANDQKNTAYSLVSSCVKNLILYSSILSISVVTYRMFVMLKLIMN